jgi:GNAT superfamily N-acetyltransferase
MIESQAVKIGYREATTEDCAAVARVHVRSWRESFAGIVPQTFLDKLSIENRTSAFEQRFSAGTYKMYVAEAAGPGILGFADFGEPRQSIDGYGAELYAIYLLPEFQRRGVGERLFNLVKEALARSGIDSMYLLALEASPYRPFYEKMGGRITGSEQIELEGTAFDVLVYGWKGLTRA